MSGRRRRARAPDLGVDPKVLEGLAKTMDESAADEAILELGAAMISPSCSMTASRVRKSTGRRLSGGRNVYQRISPRFMLELVPTLAVPPERVFRVRELARRRSSSRGSMK
jgi:hypothetical protein